MSGSKSENGIVSEIILELQKEKPQVKHGLNLKMERQLLTQILLLTSSPAAPPVAARRAALSPPAAPGRATRARGPPWLCAHGWALGCRAQP